jgi:hypothetical protein
VPACDSGGFQKGCGGSVMQQINLYQREFHDVRDWRKVGIVGAIALTLVVLGGINAVQVYDVSQLRAQLKSKTQKIKNFEQTYDVLKKNAKPKAQDLSLVAELENIKQTNSEKTRALNYLSGNGAGNTVGFSYLLEGLGRERDKINNLWLKKIKFSRGGYDLHLSGSSYEQDLLPKFVQGLSSEAIYKDREFKKIKISRAEGNKRVMDFVLDTQYQSNESSAADKNQPVALFMARLKQLATGNEVPQ